MSNSAFGVEHTGISKRLPGGKLVKIKGQKSPNGMSTSGSNPPGHPKGDVKTKKVV